MSDMLNLVPAIRAIEQELDKIDAEHKKKIKSYKDSLEQLRKINQACEHCNGTGRIPVLSFIKEDSWETCEWCEGTGLADKSKGVF